MSDIFRTRDTKAIPGPLEMSDIFGTLKKRFFRAVENGDLSTVDDLLEAKVDIDQRNSEGLTALMVAIKARQLEMITKLLQKKANIALRDRDNNTVLMYAARYFEKILWRICTLENIEVNARNNKGETALMMIAAIGSYKDVGFLIEHGAKCNIQDNDGLTALGHAARNGRVEAFRAIFRCQKRVNAETMLGALYEAIFGDWTEMTKYILSVRKFDQGFLRELYYGIESECDEPYFDKRDSLQILKAHIQQPLD